MNLPVSEAAERNKAPILAALETIFAPARRVLEIGSGTGQHAVHFAAGLSHLHWLASDRAENCAVIAARLAAAGMPNLTGPLNLDVQQAWPELDIDAVFSANTAHIMHWPAVVAMFEGVSLALPVGGRFVLYGPFIRPGRELETGNARFDNSLRAADPGMGLRELDSLEALAAPLAMARTGLHEMPANNLLLIWERQPLS
ncbi:MAG: DUF938 domain-containing protein [Gammaproteobacteria bacterium]|nr:DUF938 domain-containing protein [Gammaproteobacteria bacterium]NNM00175.1 DUF938 domain-containing protein [Gammaproteobacteria bacterium]